MFSVRRIWVLAVVITLVSCVIGTPSALSVTPSLQWLVNVSRILDALLISRRYGDDGSWSAVSIRVGTPPQWVDVMVSTVSSETWVVANGGCASGECSFFK